MSEVICPSCNTPMEEKPACTFPRITMGPMLVYACTNPNCSEKPIYGFMSEGFEPVHLHRILGKKEIFFLCTGIILIEQDIYYNRILTAERVISREFPSYEGVRAIISDDYPPLVTTIFFQLEGGAKLGIIDPDTIAWLEHKGKLLIGPHDQINELSSAIATIKRYARNIPEIA